MNLASRSFSLLLLDFLGISEGRKGKNVRIASRLGMAVIGVIGAIGVFVPTTPAFADHAGNVEGGVLNTTQWAVCRSGDSEGVDAIDRALDLIDASLVNPSVVSCSSGNQNVNAWATASMYSFAYGYAPCTGIYNSTNNRCSSKTVWLYAHTINSAPSPASQWRKTACHEFGHVGGLGHRPTPLSCLMSGESPPIYTIYDSHDINSLDASYS